MGLNMLNSPNDDHVDVVIIGAGPAGLMTGLWMAEYGIKTRIIDKRGTRALHGRADGIHVRSMEIWESFNMADTVLKHGFGINEWCLWGPSEEDGLSRKQRKCALGTDLSRFPIGMMHQGHIEATMIDAIRKRSGAEVERGTAPTSIEVDEKLLNSPSAYPIKVGIRRLQRMELEKWNTNCHRKNLDGISKPGQPSIAMPIFEEDRNDIVDNISGEEGSTETIHAKYVIGADGAQSWVRQQFDFEMNGSDENTIWGVIDLRPITNFPDIRKNCTIQSEDGTLMIIPREKGLVRVYVMFKEDDADDITLDQILWKVRSIMSPFNFDYSFCDWWTVYKTAQQYSNSYSHMDRIFLAGDAAHTHTPKGGQGMNVALQDAYNLGWKMAMVLKNHAETSILTTYERERQPVARGLIEMDSDLAKILKSESAKVKVEETRRIFERLRDYGSGVNIHYAPSVISVNPLGPTRTNLQVGKRFPSLQVYSQATSFPVEVQQLLKSDGRWRLMVFAGIVSKRLQLELVNNLGEQLGDLLNKYPLAQDGKSFLEILLIHASRESEIEIADFHSTYFSYDHEKGFDYDRIFTRMTDGPHAESLRSHSKQGLSFGTGSMVVIRPDQHVGWIGLLEEFDVLEDYFRRFMIPRSSGMV